MPNPIVVTLTPFTTVSKYRGDIVNSDILSAKLILEMQTEYRDESGVVYKVEPLPSIIGTPEELGFLAEFQSIQAKLLVLTGQI